MKKLYIGLMMLLSTHYIFNEVPQVRTKNWGDQGRAVEQIYGQASGDRVNLKNLRDEQIARFYAEAAKPNPDYLSLTPGITQGMINYITGIIADTIKKMGPPPTKFEVFTMGSMARDESGFFTDLEIGILVEELTPEIKKYFERFAQLLSDRFFLLGEHPDVGGKGLRIDEADNAPLHLKWFARFASTKQIDDLLGEALLKRKFDKLPFEGSRIFIATPQQFAEYLNPKALDDKTLNDARDTYKARIEALVENAWQEQASTGKFDDMTDAQKATARAEIRRQIKERFDGVLKPLSRKEYTTAKSLQTLVRNIRHLYGDEGLFNEYLKAREVYLQGPPKKANPHYKVNRRQELAYNKDVEELSKPLGNPANPIHGTLGESVDLKRQLYRFPEQVLTNRGFWYGLPVQNTNAILQELVDRGLFNKNFAAQLRETLNFITGLRLKEQAILRKQGFAIPATPEEWETNKNDLEESIKNLRNLQENYISFKLPQEDIDKIQDKITAAESELRNLQKMKPLDIGSILTTEEVAELNTKHLPVLAQLYQENIEFLKGNEQAFMREPASLQNAQISSLPTAPHIAESKKYTLPSVRAKEWGQKFESIKQLYAQASADRSNLARIREQEIEKFYAEEQKENPDFLALTPDITEQTISYLNNIIAEIIEKLGPPPTKFSIFAMGSMARKESGFYTDLEIGILVEEKNDEVKKYFDRFSQLLADRLYVLGEHPDVGGKGLRVDEAENAPAYKTWFARYAAPARVQELTEESMKLRNKDLMPEKGTRIFLATPEQFAGYLAPDIFQKIEEQKQEYKELMLSYINDALKLESKKPERERRTPEEIKKDVHFQYASLIKPIFGREKSVLASLPSLMRNLRHLFGDKDVFDRFVKESSVYLDGPPQTPNPKYESRRQEIVYNEFSNNIAKDITDPSALVGGTLNDEIDLKRKLYRWPEQTLTNLSYWYALNTQNGSEIIDELLSRRLLDPVFGKQLHDLLNFATGLRLKEQAVLRKQGKSLPLTQEEWAKNKTDLEEDLAYQKKRSDFLLSANRPTYEVEATHKKIVEIQDALTEINKLKPLEEGSILQAKDIELLKNKYLPILNELFRRAQAFVVGDREAFIESAQEFIKKHPSSHPTTSKIVSEEPAQETSSEIINEQNTPPVSYQEAVQQIPLPVYQQPYTYYYDYSPEKLPDIEGEAEASVMRNFLQNNPTNIAPQNLAPILQRYRQMNNTQNQSRRRGYPRNFRARRNNRIAAAAA